MKKRWFGMIIMTLLLLVGCSTKQADVTTPASMEQTVASETTAVETQASQAKQPEIDFEALAKEVVISGDSVSFTDAAGDKVTLAKKPQRVVGLYNSYTSLWYQAGGTIVGRIDSSSELPKEALDEAIQTVGGMTTVNLETVIALEPDLVILRKSKQDKLVEQLKQNKIPYIAMEYDSFKDYLKYLKIFTALTGNEQLYQTQGLDLLHKINETVGKVPSENNPNALLMFGTSSSVKAYLSNTAVGEMLSQLKANNIADKWEDTKATSVELNIEYLTTANPDYILVQCMSSVDEVKSYIEATYSKQQWWNALDAVKNGKVIYLDRSLFHYKPNDQYDKAYLELAKILYPEVFK